jgi:hypothetical protein
VSGLLRVLGTGSREFTDRGLIDLVFMDCWHDATQLGADGIEVVEGEAGGADTLMREWAEANGVVVDPVPAAWEACGPECPAGPGHRRQRWDGSEYCLTAGHRRNQLMVDRGAAVAVGFLVPGLPCKGTRDCLRRAEAAGIPVRSFEAGL